MQNELEVSKEEAAREAKRVQLFQAEMELVQSVEVRVKEELTAQRQRNAQLESEKAELISKINVNEEELQKLTVSCSSNDANTKQLLLF